MPTDAKKAVSPAGEMTGFSPLPCLYGEEQTLLFDQAWTDTRRLPLCQLMLQLKDVGIFWSCYVELQDKQSEQSKKSAI